MTSHARWVDWLYLGDSCKCWFHNFFREFEFMLTNNWMSYLEGNLFRKRFNKKYQEESNHAFDYYYYYEIFDKITYKYGEDYQSS